MTWGDAAATERVVATLPAGSRAQARELSELSNRYAEEGRWQEGLAAAERAEIILRGLPALCREHREDLAALLTNLSNRLGDLARPVDALGPAREAVLIFRELADGEPTPDVALSLNNLSIWLSEAGRRAEALIAAHEATEIYRFCVTRHRRHRPQLAAALNNLSNRLAESALPVGAEQVIAEAVGVRRDLVRMSPRQHAADLASSLNNWAYRLVDLGRGTQALPVVDEAVRLYRKLARTQPSPYRGDLAIALDTAASCFSLVARHDEAAAVSAESVAIYRSLATAFPGVYDTRLALALLTRGRLRMAAGDYAEALVAFRAAGEVVTGDPMVEVEVARGVGAAQYGRGRFADALTAYRLAVTMLPATAARSRLRRDSELGLGELKDLATDATAAAIRQGELSQAVEFLEQARGVLAAAQLNLQGSLARLRAAHPTAAAALDELLRRTDVLDRAALQAPRR
ncbi:tetratricopeptide repeat protein [Verrucosispora sp. WMMD573]|uniref:tetratricopeptide repeat protein n=1 Tax=Verrucosispora sp. WMMD573 TaxID=3015149 RepID=UPI00248C23BB|nr:tetratricopeptide repeat protein [Verrucosispora sp. WMMD573]WBB52444.1 tetratricopeptide repeat protein [Verrucosispora sp. WMMD573]